MGKRSSFDDPARGRLVLYGSEWVRDELLSHVGAKVVSARYDRRSNLTVRFGDGRELYVRDGPYQTWHYSDASGLSLHGGVGTVA